MPLKKATCRMFDEAFWGHIGHVVRNSCPRGCFQRDTRAFCDGAGRWPKSPLLAKGGVGLGDVRDYVGYGDGSSWQGKLKVQEKLTGRFADVLSWMFIATAVIKRYEDEGRKKEDKMFLDFSMAVAFQKIPGRLRWDLWKHGRSPSIGSSKGRFAGGRV